MSASRERKKRQEFIAGGGTDPKAAREAERKAKERKSNILYGTIGAVFVLVTAFLVIYNSGVLQRNATAVTIDGVNYSASDYSYFYHAVYQSYYQQYGSYTDMLVTADQLQEQTLNQMKFVQAALNRADEEGFTLDEEGEQTIQDQLDSFKSQAQAVGQSYSAYIKQVYGNLVTKSVFEENLRKGITASLFAQSYEDSLVYTDEDILAEYDANPNEYDMVDYAYISIDATPADETDEEGNTIDPTEEETAAAWEAGQALAQELLTAWENGGDGQALADAHDEAAYMEVEGATYSTLDYLEWCYTDGRQAGEYGLVENEDSGWIYLVRLDRRYRDERHSVNVRHILVTDANLEGVEDPTDEDIMAKAEEILASWDGTEDGFAALANEYSKDGGSNTNGGLYEDVLPGQMVTAFNDWCFDETRASGDTGIVQSDYGYHIMYYVGQGDLIAWQETVRDALRSADYTAWEEELVGTIESAELKDGASYAV